MSDNSASNSVKQLRIPMTASRGFVPWLISQQVSLAFTTYQTGKLFFIGHNQDGEISGYERTFERAMGLAGNDQTLYLATLFQLWRLENVLADGEALDGYDRHYVPQVGYTTGDLDIHDVALGREGRPIFVSARFSCLATTSERYHFEPVWIPRFITKLAGEDRCHLNGLATIDGKPRFVTACSQTDVVDGWRDHRRNGGVVIDVDTDEIVSQGLSMPHSPRWYRDKLWVLDSGNGQFGHVDLNSGKFEPVTFCPGFARGLSFAGDYAVVGLSLMREDKTFDRLHLQEKLASSGVSPRCGLLVINLRTGDAEEWLQLQDPVCELYDVLTLPGVRRPRVVGFKTDEIRTRVWADPQALARVTRQ